MTLPREQADQGGVRHPPLRSSRRTRALSAEMAAFSVTVAAANSNYNKGGGARRGCGYVRKHQGRSRAAPSSDAVLKGAHISISEWRKAIIASDCCECCTSAAC